MMPLQRVESVASSVVVPHGLESLNLKDGVLGSDYEQDDLLQAPSLESGIFGVLFTLSQEKNQQHIYHHWILLKILLDAWQLFTTIMSPEMGWNIDPDSTLWKCVSVLSFGWLRDLGYTWYVVVLYSMAGLLAMNLVLCVWVAWSFKEQKFDYVWPIKVVRGFSYVFLQVFDVTSLNFLQLGISCNYVGPVKPHLHMAVFPKYSCSSSPHIIHALVSGLLLLIFVAVAMLVNMSEVDVNPTSKAPQALGHSGAEVAAFGIKALMTLVSVFLGWPKVAAVAYLLLAAWLAWEYLRWVPHLLTWVNCLKGGVALAMFGVAALQLAVVLLPRSDDGGGPFPGPSSGAARTLTLAMAVSLGPVFLLGAFATYLRTRLFTAAVVRAFKSTNHELVKPQDVYHFVHPRDVEIAARCARVWTDLYTLEKGAVHRAEEIIKAGIALFPDSAFVALLYANFMLDMLGFSQTGAKQLESVRKLNPGLMCRFMLFVRQQQATQKAASSTVGKGGNMDLLGYVEYQRKQRMVLRHHKDALQAMANFWRILGASSISFSSLSKSLEEIDTSISQAETAYRVVLELYNNSPKLVRLYARFLETIKQDPWTAAQYHAAAERLEENKDEDGQGPMLPDGTPISRMDDVEKGVLVVNAFGDIQVANRKLHNMFGYKKGDLDGKNVTVLMPPHEAKRHPGLMRRYIDSGDKAAPYFRHPVLAVHRERVAFTVRIAVSRASGLGEDSVFIGLIEALPSEPGTGRVWVTPEGVIVCCDPGFVTCFGYHPEDVIGVSLDKLLRTGGSEVDRALLADIWMASKVKHDNQEYVQKLLASAFNYGSSGDGSSELLVPNKCSVLHKYDFAKEVTITVRSDMTKSSIYEVRMRLVSDEPQLLMVVERKGAIRHMSGDLAKVLGVGVADGLQTAGSGRQFGGGESAASKGDYDIAEDHVMVELMSDGLQRSLDDFLPSPWKVLHYKYRKYVKGGSSMLSGSWGCRAAGDDVGSNSVGPTMQLVGVHGKPVYVHVAVSSRDNQGEITHVVRMTRSSKEQAVAERRLRLRITQDGVVQEILQPSGFEASAASCAARATELFGFPPEQLLGCKLWEFMSHAPHNQQQQPHQRPQQQRSQQLSNAGVGQLSGTGSRPQAPSQSQLQLQLPAPSLQGQQTRNLIDEAEAMVLRGVGGGGLSSDGSDARNKRGGGGAGWAGNVRPQDDMDLRMLESMITSSLQTPGVSWRVSVLPPSALLEAAAMDNPGRAEAVLSRRTKQAVLRLDVSLPPPGATAAHGPGGQLMIFAELWSAEAVTGVLEIDGAGRISGVLEEEVRPPGLLFGLPEEDIVGSPLGALLRLLPGQSAAGLLNDSGIAKKSALKASSRKGKVVDKVGPVHYLEGFHRDHRPLSLAVQVVGKPGPGNPVTAIIRLDTPKAGAHRSSKRLNAFSTTGVAPAAAAAAAPAAAGGNGPSQQPSGPRGHVLLSLAGNGPGNGPASAPQLNYNGGVSGVGGGGGGLQLRLRQPSLSRGGVEGQLTKVLSNKPLTRGALQPRDNRAANGGGGDSGGGRNGTDDLASLQPLPPPLQLAPAASRASFRSLAAGTAAQQQQQQQQRASAGGGAAGAGGSFGAVTADAAVPLPGAVALAAGVACVISSKSLQPNISGVSGDAAAAAAAAVTPVAATKDPGSGTTRTSSPLKPESPRTADPGKRPSISPRTGADLGEEEDRPPLTAQVDGAWVAREASLRPASAESQSKSEPGGAEEGHGGDGGGGGGPGGLTLVSAMRALRDGGGSEEQTGLVGVDKWVATGGQFYKNRAPSVVEDAELEDEDEVEDEDFGSFGATSRATSSRWNSPSNSHNFRENGDEPPAPPPPYGRLHGGQNRGGHGPQSGGGVAGSGFCGQGAAGHAAVVAAGPLSFGVEDGLQDAAEATAAEAEVGLVVAVAQAPVPEDVPDDHSDGGESAYSGVSGVSGLSDSETPADFKRGKRYRKLVKLMDSPEAQRTVVLMRLHTMLIMLICGAIHIVCFALVITTVKRQSAALGNVATAGSSQIYLQRVLVETRALDQAYKGKGSNVTYTFDDVQALASSIMDDCQQFRNVNNDLLNKLYGSKEDLYYVREVEVWSGINATTKLPYYQNMTLWDMVTRIFVSAKSVFQNHGEWHRQGLNVSATLPGAFLLNSGQALIPGTIEVLNQLLDVAVSRTGVVNMLQLIFLIVEGFLVTGASAFVLVYILRSVCDQRYQLYESFLKIPVGLTRALASQTTHLLDDDESDEEEEDDGSQDHNIAEGGDGSPMIKRKALFDEGPGGGQGQDHGGGGGSGAGADHAGGGGRGGGGCTHGPSAAAARGGAYPRHAGGGVRRARRQSVDEAARSLLASAAANHTKGNATPPVTALYGTHAHVSSSSGMVDLSGNGFSLSSASLNDVGSRRQQRRGGWLSRVFGKLWRGSTVSPLPSPGPGGAHDSRGRTLERNSRIPQATLVFIGTYSLLIILFYSVSYGVLMGVRDMVALQAVAEQNAERSYRAVYYAQELVAEEDMSLLPRRLADMRAAAIALRGAYYTLRMGSHAWAAGGPSLEQFPMVRGRGAAKETAAMFRLFYADGTCLRLPAHGPCPPASDRFYQVIRSGVDGMMMQLLLELKGLADTAEAALVTANVSAKPDAASPGWDFVYNVGTADLFDGNKRIVAQHMDDVRRVFSAIVVLHVVLLLLLLGVFLAFLMVIYLPLLRRMTKEKRRIAEMMSQLPAELDVMRLVSTALMGPNPSATHRGHHRHHNQLASSSSRRVARSGNFTLASGTGMLLAPSGPSGTQMLRGDPASSAPAAGVTAGGAVLKISSGEETPAGNKAYQTWKDILHRTSNPNLATKEVAAVTAAVALTPAKRSFGRA